MRCIGHRRTWRLRRCAIAASIIAGLAWWPVGFAAQDEAPESNADDSTSATDAEDAADEAIDVDAILNRPLDEEEYSETRKCVWMRMVDDVEVLDDTMVLFHGRRGELWLNQLSSQCMGLTADMIVDVRGYGGSVCRLDQFRGRPRIGGFALTANCRLGTFESIEPLQAESLRVAALERRKSAANARSSRKKQRGSDATQD